MRKNHWASHALLFLLSLFLLFGSLSACSTAMDDDPKNDDPIVDPIDDPDDPIIDPVDEVIKVEDLTYFPKDPEEPIIDVKKLNFDSTSNRFILREFSSGITLYASTAPGKPAKLPSKTLASVLINPSISNPTTPFVDPVPVYSNGHRTVFVQKGGDEKRWFAIIENNSNIKKLVWQVSEHPYINADSNWKNPAGLLGSGELTAQTKEFTIDFRNMYGLRVNRIASRVFTGLSMIQGDYLNPKQVVFYVRVIPLDENDKPIGNPGYGLEILYGDRLTQSSSSSIPFVLLYDLLSTEEQGTPIFTGEFQNTLVKNTEIYYQPKEKSPWHFRPEGYPKTTDTFLIQVTRIKPDNSLDGWRYPTGLIYQKEIKKGNEIFTNLPTTSYSIPIDFNKMTNTSTNVFYIRFVALSPGSAPGTVKANYSKVVKVNYGDSKSEITYFVPPEVKKIDANIPQVKLVEYEPIQWEYFDWMYWYEVVRQPTYKEYFTFIPANQVPMGNELVPGYEVGTIIRFTPPSEQDESWLKEAWDAVSDYFSDIVSFVAKVTNWVSKAYADAKVGLAKFVAQNLPLIPDKWRDDLQKELEKLIDYGLVTLGIPPTLPNFDDLTKMGTDYLAATALTQLGLPDTDFNMDTIKDLGKGISKELNQSASSGSSPNPLDWKFVRPYSKALYRPAYMHIEITNNTKEVTAPGVLEGRIHRTLAQSEMADGNKMTLSASFGGTKYFELFLPVKNVIIPRLVPGQTMLVPIYLTEYTGYAYPFHSKTVSQNEFLSMYNNLDYFEFDFKINYELPSAQEYSKQLKLSQDFAYEYKTDQSSIYFKIQPFDRYIP
ncbi:MAG: hypothetical protein CVU94_04190 [Firmicutes bacterium HGW-Firmicutes-19]|nr:MAG: hypothetical protein CVU94_04190 [Firmicutes bacterium HGW-Firmicutes-19]